ncbi:MAG: lipase [Mycobacterium sp.]|nr:lipase [Mycobacterium sp.]
MFTTVAVLVALTASAVACSNPQQDPPTPAAEDVVALSGDFSGSGPGTLKTATRLSNIDRRMLKVAAMSARVEYESQSGVDGSPQTVSGVVFAPFGTPPAGGWPIIAFGHPSSGVQWDCAPSQSPWLLSLSEGIAALVKAGFIVTMTDYQGLGVQGTYHPYLDPTTEGMNVIDSVRAAQKLVPDASDRWVGVGVSQGGQAVWAANELASTYGAGLELLGSASASPALDISPMADTAAAGQLTTEQTGAYVWILEALSNMHPDFDLDDYRHGLAKEKWDTLIDCGGESSKARLDLSKQLTPDDLKPSSPAAVDKLRGYLQQMSLPKVPAAAPILVMHGDSDRLVPSDWTEAAIKKACDMGDNVTSFIGVGKGHDDVQAGSVITWVQQRFNGEEAKSTCAMPDGPSVKIGATPWYAQ